VKKYPTELSPKIRELLDVAYRNAERLLNLIHQLLESQELETGKVAYDLKVFPIQQLLVDAVKLSEPVAKNSQVCLKLEDPLSASCVQADYERLMEVMTNLLSNAIRFSPQGSSVFISTLDQGEWIRVAVKDEGKGIPEGFSSQIFQRFARGSHNDKGFTRGSGLGLSICKVIIEGLGGKIGYKSVPNQGSVFYFDLKKQIGSS
jgi:signal transduction histidine kinase